MNTLWIFNPDNDIALGNNLRNFTPPRNAMLLREAGAMLPAWMADDGDLILSNNPADAHWLQSIATILGKNISLLSRNNINKVEAISPWGWSRAIACTLRNNGILPHLLPSDDKIEKIRQLSHRRSSIIINRQLSEMGLSTSIPTEITDIRQLQHLLADNSPIVIKSPWSSSGRGVIYSDNIDSPRLLRQAEGIIRNQGSVLVEQKLNKLIDFAMLFEMNNGKANYIGLSLFNTLSGGNYTGNIVASEQHLTEIISRYLSPTLLNQLRNSLETILSDLIGNTYHGICGIDMMIYRDDYGNNRIAPCVELNLRCTMGYLSHCLARNVLAPEMTGEMNITYTGNNPSSTIPSPPLSDQSYNSSSISHNSSASAAASASAASSAVKSPTTADQSDNSSSISHNSSSTSSSAASAAAVKSPTTVDQSDSSDTTHLNQPQFDANNRLLSGTLPLTPPNPHFSITLGVVPTPI